MHAAGFCGWAEQDANACEPQETYQEGGVIALSYGIRANHGGFLKCRICTDPNNMSEECFNQHILQTCAPALRWLPCTCAVLPAAAQLWFIKVDEYSGVKLARATSFCRSICYSQSVRNQLSRLFTTCDRNAVANHAQRMEGT